MLDMPYIRGLEVATFYTQFQLHRSARSAHVQVCGTTPCMLRGAEELMEVCQRKIPEQPHTRRAMAMLSWEEVECLGACVNAPMVLIFKDTYEDLTPEGWKSCSTRLPGAESVHPARRSTASAAPEGPDVARWGNCTGEKGGTEQGGGKAGSENVKEGRAVKAAPAKKATKAVYGKAKQVSTETREEDRPGASGQAHRQG